MSKALFGHVGGPNPLLLAEVARLRARVAELEAEVEELRAARAAQAALDLPELDPVLAEDLRSLHRGEPVLA